MSIFNILDDVYDVESPMEKNMSAAKKKKDKSVTVTKKEKDPFLDGFNLFANEEKKEKSHLDSARSGGALNRKDEKKHFGNPDELYPELKAQLSDSYRKNSQTPNYFWEKSRDKEATPHQARKWL